MKKRAGFTSIVSIDNIQAYTLRNKDFISQIEPGRLFFNKDTQCSRSVLELFTSDKRFSTEQKYTYHIKELTIELCTNIYKKSQGFLKIFKNAKGFQKYTQR